MLGIVFLFFTFFCGFHEILNATVWTLDTSKKTRTVEILQTRLNIEGNMSKKMSDTAAIFSNFNRSNPLDSVN